MANNKTYSPKKEEIERKWYLIDAAGVPVGKIAAEVATLLRGKHKPEYSFNVDTGDFVIVINCKDAVFTGNKLEDKKYYKHSGYVGGLKTRTAKQLMEKSPEKVIFEAVKGMIPRNRMGRAQMKKLRVYSGAEHEQAAQQPEVWEVK